ncbi:MAG: IS1096 element passenger TnpR family protein [Thermodesulfobacteriota bacterium]
MNVRLREIESAIWRRLLVPASISRDRLHDVLQIVMGWPSWSVDEGR